MRQWGLEHFRETEARRKSAKAVEPEWIVSLQIPVEPGESPLFSGDMVDFSDDGHWEDVVTSTFGHAEISPNDSEESDDAAEDTELYNVTNTFAHIEIGDNGIVHRKEMDAR